MANQLKFEMPKGVMVEKESQTDRYAKLIIEPFESGFGHTLGNSLRRVLLSSLEGAAITDVKIDGVSHEFSTIPGVFEDVTHLLLNLKKVLFKVNSRKPTECTLKVTKAGEVTASAIVTSGDVEILNPDHYLCTLDKKSSLNIEMSVEVGLGYRPADLNKNPNQAIGVIPMDSLFSPIEKVKYAVEAARVGMKTDYDRLILEVWSDGRIDPVAATVQSAILLNDHVSIFCNASDPMYLEGDPEDYIEVDETAEAEVLEEVKSDYGRIDEQVLSKRTTNALLNAGIVSLDQLILQTERELMNLRNFGARAINEVHAMLKEHTLKLKEEPATEDEMAALMRKATKK